MANSYSVSIFVAPPTKSSVGHAFIGIVPNDSSGQGSYYGLHPQAGAGYGPITPTVGFISRYDNINYPNAIPVGTAQLSQEQGEALLQHLESLANPSQGNDPQYALFGTYYDRTTGLYIDGLNCVRWADKTLQDWAVANGLVDSNGNNPLDFYPDIVRNPYQALGWTGFPVPGYSPHTDPAKALGYANAMDFCRNYMGAARNTITNSPIALDLGSNGLNLISKDDSSAFFDMDMDGFREKVQWVGAGDAFLARDVDGNGRIDDRTELFGDTEGFADGWAKLATLDSNSDGIISADDAAWGSLLVWRDLDGDGFSDEGELVSLAEAGVASISLDADAALASTFTRTDNTTGQAQDIFLDQDPMLTTYGGDFTLDPETLFLPWLRGYGQVADLPVAMSRICLA